MSLDTWQDAIHLPTKGVGRAHGKKRLSEASRALSHRQQMAIHTTCGGAGVVGQLREQGREKITKRQV